MPHIDANWRPHDSFHEEWLQPHTFNLAIVGNGALGSQICLELTRVLHDLPTRVTLIDPDVLTSHNVPASEVWGAVVTKSGQQVTGNYKSELLAQHFGQIATRTQWVGIPSEIADVGWKILQDADIIMTCTDSVVSRMETAYAARMLGKPMLDAGVFGKELIGGRVAWYAPQAEAACYACGLSAATRAASLEYISSSSLSCSTMPLIEAMGNSMEGSCSIALVAKAAVQQLERPLPLNQSYVVRFAEGGSETLTLSPSSECPWHHGTELIALDDDRPIRDYLSQEDVLLLPWAMALTSVCETCGEQDTTPMRVATLRYRACCCHCGATRLRPERVIDRIVYEDQIADQTPVQIGLPIGNVLPARKRIQPQRTF